MLSSMCESTDRNSELEHTFEISLLGDVKLPVKMPLERFRHDMKSGFKKDQISTTKWGESIKMMND